MISKTYDNISEEDFYKLYFRLINAMDPSNALSDKQINLITEFLLIKGEKFKHARFGLRAKRLVSKVLLKKYDRKMSDQNMITTLLRLERLGYIEKDVDGIKYFNRQHQRKMNEVLSSGKFSEFIFKVRVK